MDEFDRCICYLVFRSCLVSDPCGFYCSIRLCLMCSRVCSTLHGGPDLADGPTGTVENRRGRAVSKVDSLLALEGRVLPFDPGYSLSPCDSRERNKQRRRISKWTGCGSKQLTRCVDIGDDVEWVTNTTCYNSVVQDAFPPGMYIPAAR